MGLPRVAPKGGIEIGGRHFPEGTTLSINPWVLHRNKEIWGADANEFRPERWLGPEAGRLEKFFIPVSPAFGLALVLALSKLYDSISSDLAICPVLDNILLVWNYSKSAPP